MNGLKALVIGMGIMIVVGIGLVGYGLSRSHVAAAPGSGEKFSADLPIPHGYKLVSLNTTQDRVILLLSGADGDRILMLDAHDGHVAGSVSLVAESH